MCGVAVVFRVVILCWVFVAFFFLVVALDFRQVLSELAGRE